MRKQCLQIDHEQGPLLWTSRYHQQGPSNEVCTCCGMLVDGHGRLPECQKLRRPGTAQEGHCGRGALQQWPSQAPGHPPHTLDWAPLGCRLHQVGVVPQPALEGLQRSAGFSISRFIIIWLLRNLVEANFDLFRYLLLGDLSSNLSMSIAASRRIIVEVP